MPATPIENSYLVPGTRLFAGEYPGSPPSSPASDLAARLARFFDAGITAFVDLTDPADGLAPYVPDLEAIAATRGIQVHHELLTIRDMDVCDASHLRRILDAIDGHLAAGRGVYVHCWGGIGRTGMVVGSWLVRRGCSGEDALREVNALFRTMSPGKVARHESWGSPQTEPQRQMVRDWSRQEGAAGGSGSRQARPAGTGGAHARPSDRFHGALLGLAVGDALGATLEFQRPGTFRPVTDMLGGGPFGLEPGQWTDDTSMALCLAESLLECGGFDAADQMRRYVRWWTEGYWSSIGRCFDIGNTTRQALAEFQRTGEPLSGPTSEHSAGNGSLMRLAPVPLFFSESGDPIRWAAESSRTTHGARAAVDACRYLASLILDALRGRTKEELLDPGFGARFRDAEALHPEVAAVAAGSFLQKSPPAIRGTGYVVDCLEAALWAFATTDDFASGALAAVNLGDDADTTGAVYGQIAGAYYGASAIPEHWRARITRRDDILRVAERLYLAAQHATMQHATIRMVKESRPLPMPLR